MQDVFIFQFLRLMLDLTDMEKKPNPQEIDFLKKSYNFFLDIYEEIWDDPFWEKDPYYRLSRIKDALLTYSEILEYEPIGWFLDELRKLRPQIETEISKEYILFLRNLLIHFPFFISWNEIKFSRLLINWSVPGRSIDKFLKAFAGHPEIKYRIWMPKLKKMIYVTIKFPTKYNDDEILLCDLVTEREGIIFLMSIMHRVIMSQVEDIKPA